MAAKKTRKRTSTRKSTTKRRVGAVVHHHTSSPRRRSYKKVSGIGALSAKAEMVIGAVGGAFIARIVQKNIPAPTDKTKTDYRPYAGLILGGAAIMFGKKNIWLESAGVGAIVEGSRALITDQMIPSMITQPALKGNRNNQLPYTAGHNQVRLLNGNKKRNKLMNGSPNAIIGKSPKVLASVYDGL